MRKQPKDASILKRRVSFWANRIGVDPKEIHVRRMKRKWASCSSRGRITLNIDLAKEKREFVDEVVIHELLHLKLPKHGKFFNALLKTYLRGDGTKIRPRK
jgi:predicted metal-dependent hydrolase